MPNRMYIPPPPYKHTQTVPKSHLTAFAVKMCISWAAEPREQDFRSVQPVQKIIRLKVPSGFRRAKRQSHWKTHRSKCSAKTATSQSGLANFCKGWQCTLYIWLPERTIGELSLTAHHRSRTTDPVIASSSRQQQSQVIESSDVCFE